MTIYVPHSKILIAGLSYVQPVAAASYLQVKVIAEVTMPDVLAVEIVTPVDDAILAFEKALAESETLTDRPYKTAGKTLTDSVTTVEDIQYIHPHKGLSDTEALLEELAYVFTKGVINDTILPSDNSQFVVDKVVSPDLAELTDDITSVVFTKVLADSISFTDSAEAHKLYIRVFDEELTVPDAEAWSFLSGTTAETASTSDVYNHVLTKNLFESTVLIDNMDGDIQYAFIKLIGELLTSSDSKVVDFTANKSDNVTSSDGGVLSMQDYCDITYFAEDYVGISRTF